MKIVESVGGLRKLLLFFFNVFSGADGIIISLESEKSKKKINFFKKNIS